MHEPTHTRTRTHTHTHTRTRTHTHTHTHTHTRTRTRTRTCTHTHTHTLVLVLAPLPLGSRGLLFQGGNARQNGQTGNPTGCRAASLDHPVQHGTYGRRKLHPPMGSPHHSEWEGWGAAHSDGISASVQGSRLHYPTLCGVIAGN